MGFFKDLGKVGKSIGQNFTSGVTNKNDQIQANVQTQLTNAELALIAARTEQEQELANAEMIKNITYFSIFILFMVVGYIIYKKSR